MSKKISVLMDADVHEKLKKIQEEKELRSISSAIRSLLKEVAVGNTKTVSTGS